MSTVCLSHTNQFGLLSASEWTLSPLQTLLIPVQRGDLLQALQGTVWITLHGQPQDLFLSGAETHTMSQDALLHISGFDEPRFKVISQRPLRTLQCGDVSGWRSWLLKARFWKPLVADFKFRIAA